MTDYLGNLLTRSFAPAEQGVRPRIPSMFEPISPSVLPGRFLESTPEDLSPGGTQYSDTRPTRQEKNDPTDSRDAGPAPTPLDRPAEAATPSTVARASIPVAAAASATPEKPSLLPRAETAPVSLGRPPTRTESAAPHGSAPNTLSPNPVRPAAPADENKTAMTSPASPVAPFPPAVSDSTHRDNRRPTVEPQRSPVEPSPFRPLEPPPANVIAHRLRTERAPTNFPAKQPARAKKRSEVPQAAAAAPPTIQVTIGRVEVRATTSATPQRPKSKKEPEMSLETYLAKRAEGDFR